MFSQGEATRRRAPGGLGIGLGLARKLVELHGGTIEARSAGLGQGSEFTVRMPVLASSQALVVAPAQHAAVTPRRILIVDDNADAAESLGMVLEQMGHAVRLARDGHTALAAAQRDPPEIILADIGLPDLDGFALAARLREDRRFDNVPLIAVTGYGHEIDRKRARQAGFDEHLVKPVDPARLRTALQMVDWKTL
jgi:CheY-like chemotaxis protein